ncbi:MAG TPA: sugar phosphate nucleotidyltransferase [archaeon]|nr:sugar phosphate nucleotidyltransferase [archaeon]
MKAVILAGGLGARLKPFTQIIPKPLLPVGESSVLEIQILSLKKYGFNEIFIATNYMADYVQTYLGDGSKYNVKITFSKEEKPLGTCGPLSLLKDHLDEPFLLMNGDILTTMDFAKAYDFSLNIDADITVVTKEIITPFNFGEVVCENDYIVDVHEKPDFRNEILSGIYFLKPNLFEIIPSNTYYGMDMLIKEMLGRGMKVAKYLMHEYWIDIGQISDLQAAQDVYKNHFQHIKKV